MTWTVLQRSYQIVPKPLVMQCWIPSIGIQQDLQQACAQYASQSSLGLQRSHKDSFEFFLVSRNHQAKKTPGRFRSQGFGLEARQCPTLTWGGPTLPSAIHRFTSEFGMGSGGSNALLPPGKLLGRRQRLLPSFGSSVKNCVLRSEIFITTEYYYCVV